MDRPAFTGLVDLASARLGGRVLEATDDFFAEKENLIKQEEAVFKTGLYTDRGKWMDGWESRRKRTPGHDWAVVALGMRGRIRGLDVDTSHFRGNHPPHVSLEGRDGEGPWTELVPRTAIDEDTHNFIPVQAAQVCTHVRLHIYPDGGVARLRVFGDVVPVLPADGREIELSAIAHGGLAIACSDEHFCRMANLLLPDSPRNMGDGWETRRRRGPGHDWVTIRLAGPSVLSRVDLDTAFYKGNYPDRCRLEGCLGDPQTAPWQEALPETPMKADHLHRFEAFRAAGPFDHLRLCIYPDGGVARLRAFGRLV
ncbi:MAG: allantoicase [Rhodothermales bacterium]|nr:allantoicase [Rhodothermales bacterium]MBO6778633.1 allantoicase [Rhodothermales bacterium]